MNIMKHVCVIPRHLQTFIIPHHASYLIFIQLCNSFHNSEKKMHFVAILLNLNITQYRMWSLASYLNKSFSQYYYNRLKWNTIESIINKSIYCPLLSKLKHIRNCWLCLTILRPHLFGFDMLTKTSLGTDRLKPNYDISLHLMHYIY